MEEYRSEEWTRYREEVIRLDGGACLRCGRSRADGATLQVHHQQYIRGRKPWDYPLNSCETVCAGCHAALHGIIPPKFGWSHVAWDDLGETVGSCECCGTSIRYVFMVTHPDWRPMEVGEICCDHLTSTGIASGFMESRRRYAHRLKTFIGSSRWRVEHDGIHRIGQKRRIIRIIPVAKLWAIRIDWVDGKKMFGSLTEAKEKAFDVIESGQFEEYLSRRTASRVRRKI